ncbi:CFI-box-CTERM domain-containing protein [Methyloligella sp. 2.7D]|uniref:CFI-box-CTERM domain-containing protein n=1 Tax=unclassified Methyloligella TaxID=2625955 RepID=UPI00157D444A|nr:CFI-box-CTERM domain-containing protein [Methyloligella sp. GL2]QKP77209.1 hypothetical protein HT051_06915 [Methyloligella sp. GL2]
MLLTTRRRILGLMAAAAGTQLLRPVPGFAQDSGQTQNQSQDQNQAPNPDDFDDSDFGDESADAPSGPPDCYTTKDFGEWTGLATSTVAAARIPEVKYTTKCDLLWIGCEVNDNYDSRLSLFGDPDMVPLPKDMLIKDSNTITVRNAKGDVLMEKKLCGVCNQIEADTANVIMPTAFGVFLRSEKSLQLTLKIGDKQTCGFNLDLEPMRQALSWAQGERERLLADAEAGKCEEPAVGCFMTTACCSLLGLPDDCFELRTLRRYRDTYLAKAPGGPEAIARYYRLAPQILHALEGERHDARLLKLYWLDILPSAIAAKLGLNRLAYRRYSAMMDRLNRELLTVPSI